MKGNSEMLVSDAEWGGTNGKGSNSGVVATYVLHSSPYLWSPLPSFLFVIFGLVGSLI